MSNEKLRSEIAAVKSLGEQIGYGHLMELASALWRKNLKDAGYPVSGAFYPMVLCAIEKDMVERTENTRKGYDAFINDYSS